MSLYDFYDTGLEKVIIAIAADDDCVNDWDVGDFAGQFGISLWPEKGESGATTGEDWVEENV